MYRQFPEVAPSRAYAPEPRHQVMPWLLWRPHPVESGLLASLGKGTSELRRK